MEDSIVNERVRIKSKKAKRGEYGVQVTIRMSVLRSEAKRFAVGNLGTSPHQSFTSVHICIQAMPSCRVYSST